MFRKKPKVQVPVEWLIVGLGNPGPEYSGTRHNVGFEVIDALAVDNRIKLDTSKHRARFGLGMVGGVGVAIAKPITFMNLSGQAVAPLLREFSLKPERLIVVADETDLPIGRIRVKPKGGAGGHGGHKSIIQLIGTQNYARIRLGIGRVGKDETIDHVLGKFHPDERADAQRMVQKAAEAVEAILVDGLEKAMSRINERENGSADE